MRFVAPVLLLAAACSKATPEPAETASSATASAAVVFDIDAFCDKALGVGRPCEGDDELLEGNKIGLCTTTLREAGVALDPALGSTCLAAVEAGKPLPDLRTLELLAARFDPCRKLLSPVPALARVEPRAAGRVTAGQPCAASANCAAGLFCAGPGAKKICTPQKKAGEACTRNEECLGRCSAQGGKQCAPYCGAG